MLSAMCRHQQQFQPDEQDLTVNHIFKSKTKPGSGSGLDVQ
jgi:hypothetical protein